MTVDAFMYFWSWLFSPLVATVLFAFLALAVLVKRGLRDAITVGLAGSAMLGAVELLKRAVGRVRPHEDPSLWATGGSFPSGHAAAAACFALLFTWFFTHPHHRRWVGTLMALLAVCVGGSRLYFGVHYPSDVIVGYLVGSLAAGAAVYVDSRRKMR